MKPVILFDAVPLLVDGRRMRQQYRAQMAEHMAARYGKTPLVWQQADEQIITDWDSYHADLNFAGDDGLADMHEAAYRLTRALFTITRTPEPSQNEITALAQELMGLPCHEAAHPEMIPVLEQCARSGFQTGTIAYMLEAQLRAVTAGLPYLAHCIGADTVGHYLHNQHYFRKIIAHLGTPPELITFITIDLQAMQAATSTGIRAYLLDQAQPDFTHAIRQILGAKIYGSGNNL